MGLRVQPQQSTTGEPTLGGVAGWPLHAAVCLQRPRTFSSSSTSNTSASIQAPFGNHGRAYRQCPLALHRACCRGEGGIMIRQTPLLIAPIVRLESSGIYLSCVTPRRQECGIWSMGSSSMRRLGRGCRRTSRTEGSEESLCLLPTPQGQKFR